ncbi:MAG TPA: DUF4113 domain-containing protein, partial [Flavobacterium sp.]
KQFTPSTELYSIDESFMNFEGMNISDYNAYGHEIRSRIKKWLSIPVCVGFAPSKALSKVANKIARKYPAKTNGVYVIDSDEKRIKALKWTQIGDVWGIGYRMKKKLIAHNINTAFDFIDPKHSNWIKGEMGVTGLRLVSELEGKPVLEMEIPSDKKSIMTTRSFPKKLADFDSLRERVSTFASVCAEKLRDQKSCCHTIVVMLGTLEHKTAHTKMYYQQTVTLPFATNSTLTISETAVKLLEKLYNENQGQQFHKAGVTVTQLINEGEKQFDMFTEENPKHLGLMKAIDKINGKLGGRKVKLASQDGKTWNMRQNLLSPKYTTDFNDLLTIKCQ